MRLGKAEAALQDAELAISFDAEYAKGYLRRGVAYASMKNWEDAIRDFNKVCLFSSYIGCVSRQLRLVHWMGASLSLFLLGLVIDCALASTLDRGELVCLLCESLTCPLARQWKG